MNRFGVSLLSLFWTREDLKTGPGDNERFNELQILSGFGIGKFAFWASQLSSFQMRNDTSKGLMFVWSFGQHITLHDSWPASFDSQCCVVLWNGHKHWSQWAKLAPLLLPLKLSCGAVAAFLRALVNQTSLLFFAVKLKLWGKWPHSQQLFTVFPTGFMSHWMAS